MSKSRILVVAMHGASRAGKDTARDVISRKLNLLILNDRLDIKVHHVDFADPLRKATCELLGVSPVQLQSTNYRKQELQLLEGATPVQFMQLLGTEFCREGFNDNYWVDLMKQKLMGLAFDGGMHIILVSDCRFPNEVALLQAVSHYSKHLLIHNPSSEFTDHSSDAMNKLLLDPANANNIPETIPLKQEHVWHLHNNSTLDHYQAVVAEWTDYLILDLPTLLE